MRSRRLVVRYGLLAVAAASLLMGCGEEPRDAITMPVSPEAADINWLWWFSLGLGVVVYVAVMALLVVPLVRNRRRRAQPSDPPQEATVGSDSGPARRSDGMAAPAAIVDEPVTTADRALADESRADERVRSRLIWWGGLILPAIILSVLLVAASVVGVRTAHVAEDGDLVIEVVGHMFWWEVIYPEQDIITANEIVIPVDQRVRVVLTTDDVIHSFWIPRLHGKVDQIPGTVNTLTFTATEEGFYRGHCAEYCGTAHAQMVKFVEAVSPEEFDSWVAQQQQPPVGADLDGVEFGERVFLQTGCADCHAVRGTAAIGVIGPDLSHLASRRTLAAGILPNTRDNLQRLILDPWGVKPGNPMPPTALDADEVEALLDYLETLSAEGASRMEGSP